MHRITRMKLERSRRRAAKLSCVIRLKLNALTIHTRTSLIEEFQSDVIAMKFNTDLIENPVGLILDPLQG
jgi:hypothetical protein